VNLKYLVALGGLVDAFDTDNGFSGRIQFGLIIQDPSSLTSQAQMPLRVTMMLTDRF
jgi:hypothetical protein